MRAMRQVALLRWKVLNRPGVGQGGQVSSRGSITVDRGGVKPLRGGDAGAGTGLGVLEL